MEKSFSENHSHIVVHDVVPYERIDEVLSNSKIVLNSIPTMKHGAHERIFSSFACGALPLSSESVFLKEQFNENEDLLFYRPNHWSEANLKIEEILKDENHRCEMVKKGYDKTMRDHTWDHRAKSLLEHIEHEISRLTE